MPLDILTIAIRFALYANLMVVFGWPLFALYALPADASVGTPSRRALALLTLTAMAFSVAGIVAMSAAMAGTTFMAVDGARIAAMVFETPMGSAWQTRMVALALLLATALVVHLQPRRAYVVTTIAAAIALASLAWTGHGAAGEGTSGWLQLGADVTHLLAAGAWLGALAALARVLIQNGEKQTIGSIVIAYRALDRFAIAGTIIVGLLIVTGLISAWILVGLDHAFDLLASEYGRLLIIKLMLFAGMLGLAAINRFRLTPTLGRQIAAGASSAIAFTALRRSIVIETALAVGILVIVAWLGTLAPPMAM